MKFPIKAIALLVLALAIGGTLPLIGCRSARSKEPPVTRVWPAPPDAPRIAFVQTIHRPGDVGVHPSGFKRFARWITGSEKGNEPLIKPFGIALDEAGNLCLTDTGANAVCYFDRAKKKWLRWLNRLEYCPHEADRGIK